LVALTKVYSIPLINIVAHSRSVFNVL